MLKNLNAPGRNWPVLAIACAALLPAAAAAQTVVTLQFGGQPRTYVLHQPAGYNPASSYPLMLVEHGEFGTGQQMEATTHFDQVADAYGFFVAYPNSVGNSWVLAGPNNDVDFNAAVVTSVQTSFTIDPARVFISGFSDGGRMADAFACSRPAGAVVAGLGIVANDLTARAAYKCMAQPPIAYILFHGTADPISPYLGNHQQASAHMTAKLWASHDGCYGAAQISQIADELSSGAPTTDEERAWSSCATGRTVTFYTINGGGHNWPGSINHVQNPVPATGPVSLDLDASLLIWQSLGSFSAAAFR